MKPTNQNQSHPALSTQLDPDDIFGEDWFTVGILCDVDEKAELFAWSTADIGQAAEGAWFVRVCPYEGVGSDDELDNPKEVYPTRAAAEAAAEAIISERHTPNVPAYILRDYARGYRSERPECSEAEVTERAQEYWEACLDNVTGESSSLDEPYAQGRYDAGGRHPLDYHDD